MIGTPASTTAIRTKLHCPHNKNDSFVDGALFIEWIANWIERRCRPDFSPARSPPIKVISRSRLICVVLPLTPVIDVDVFVSRELNPQSFDYTAMRVVNRLFFELAKVTF